MKHTLGKKAVSIIILIGTLLSSCDFFLYPKKVHALGDEWATAGSFFLKIKSNVDDSINTADVTRDWAKLALEQVAMGIAKSFLKKVTLSTIDWINTGFEGNPLFIENPETFFTDFANQERDALIGTIAYDPINYPYGRNFAQNLILSLQNKFERNAQFTLQSVIGQRHWSVFVNRDFRAGGWNGYLALSQPQNNPYGFALLAQEEEAFRTRGTTNVAPGEQLRQELEQAGGILTPKICIPGQLGYAGKWTNEQIIAARLNATRLSMEGNAELAAQIRGEIEAHTCDESKKQSTTPGIAITSQLEKALGSAWTQSELGAALGTNLSAVFDALLNQFAQKGLTALSKTVNGGNTETPAERNLDYYGLSVGTAEGGNDWRNTPDRIVNLEELLITGTPGKGALNPSTNEYGNGPTVIALMEQEVQTYRDILTRLEAMPSRLLELDVCLPGPDYGWEERLQDVTTRSRSKLDRKATKSNDDRAAEADEALRLLEVKAAELTWFIKNKFFDNIPSAITIGDTIQRTSKFSISAKTYQDKILAKTTILSRLRALSSEYQSATTVTEKNRVASQYLDMEAEVSTETSLRQARTELANMNDMYGELVVLKSICGTERIQFGLDDSSTVLAGADTTTMEEPFTGLDIEKAFTEITGMAYVPSRKGLSAVSTVEVADVIDALSDYGVSVTSEQKAELSEMTKTRLTFFYALISQKGLTPEDALDAVLNDMPEDASVSQEYSNEMLLYCRNIREEGVYEGGDLWGLFTSLDIEIDCVDFYHSDIWDYRIEKNY